VQVGVVAVGQPFPFWVRSKAMLTLRVSAAVPTDLVRLVGGCEVYVAPRPRQQGTAAAAPGSSSTAAGVGPPAESPAPVWLRIQVSDGTTWCDL
jgi:Peroxisome biogenesis factor 1, N-terminal